MTFPLSALFDSAANLEDFRFFPSLFGSGADGVATISADTDGGNGTLGFKQYSTLTVNNGIKLWTPPGSGNGGIIIACNGVFTLNGSLIGDGGNGGNGVLANSGAGGSGAGGPAGQAGQPTDAAVGTASNNAATILGGGSRGGYGAYSVSTSQTQLNTNHSSGTIPTTLQTIFNGFGRPFDQTTFLGNSLQNYDQAARKGVSKFCMFGGYASEGAAATFSSAGGRGWGGGAGGGGALIYIAAKHIVFGGSAALSAKGGNGGNGNSNNANYTGFGGAGGQGGRIILLCDTYTGTVPTPTLTGGTNGTQGINGTSSGGGASGANGQFLLLSIRGAV